MFSLESPLYASNYSFKWWDKRLQVNNSVFKRHQFHPAIFFPLQNKQLACLSTNARLWLAGNCYNMLTWPPVRKPLELFRGQRNHRLTCQLLFTSVDKIIKGKCLCVDKGTFYALHKHHLLYPRTFGRYGNFVRQLPIDFHSKWRRLKINNKWSFSARKYK